MRNTTDYIAIFTTLSTTTSTTEFVQSGAHCHHAWRPWWQFCVWLPRQKIRRRVTEISILAHRRGRTHKRRWYHIVAHSRKGTVAYTQCLIRVTFRVIRFRYESMMYVFTCRVIVWTMYLIYNCNFKILSFFPVINVICQSWWIQGNIVYCTWLCVFLQSDTRMNEI